MHFVQVAALNRKETKCIYSHISWFSPLPLSQHRAYINIDNAKRQINTPFQLVDWFKQFSPLCSSRIFEQKQLFKYSFCRISILIDMRTNKEICTDRTLNSNWNWKYPIERYEFVCMVYASGVVVATARACFIQFSIKGRCTILYLNRGILRKIMIHL